MTSTRRVRPWLALVVAVGGLMSPLAPPVLGAAAAPAAALVGGDDWSESIWALATHGTEESFLAMLDRAPVAADDPGAAKFRQSVELLRANIAKREEARATRVKEVEADLDKALAEPRSDLALSRALKSSVELHMIATDKKAVLNDPRVRDVVAQADAAARAAEARSDWLTASELFARLDLLLEEQGLYRDDLKRQTTRLAMIRMYAPERFWELRNVRRIAEKEDDLRHAKDDAERKKIESEPALPPYNPTADDFHDKLAGVSAPIVVTAISRAAKAHVEQTPMSDILKGGIGSLRTLATAQDLAPVFPSIAIPEKRERFLAFLDQESRRITDAGPAAGFGDLNLFITRVTEVNAETLQVPEVTLLHEFGNGAMGALDEFSAIIWPDEIKRFERSTKASFIGVGIQIRLDELLNIQVVTPLEDTPAQRAGVRAGDLIKKIDGKSTIGFTLDQAVDVITGPKGTKVLLTVEREIPGENGAESRKEQIDVPLVRDLIKVTTAKGWKKTGAREEDWEWMIDPEGGIGYVRLTQFAETTDRELEAAVKRMKSSPSGLRGLVLDLRFNPGGLLDQAVAVSSFFLKKDSIVVSTESRDGQRAKRERALGGGLLADIPVVVLVNEGSASASEIVSGAIQDYAEKGQVKAILLGQRSFGKGSVQNVWPLQQDGALAAIKLTTQYYRLPGGRLIHRRPGASQWGVDPNLDVDMLPKQTGEALTLRQDADVIRLDENGKPLADKTPAPNPDDLISKGLDLQLEAALVLLQSQAQHGPVNQVMIEKPARANN